MLDVVDMLDGSPSTKPWDGGKRVEVVRVEWGAFVVGRAFFGERLDEPGGDILLFGRLELRGDEDRVGVDVGIGDLPEAANALVGANLGVLTPVNDPSPPAPFLRLLTEVARTPLEREHCARAVFLLARIAAVVLGEGTCNRRLLAPKLINREMKLTPTRTYQRQSITSSGGNSGSAGTTSDACG